MSGRSEGNPSKDDVPENKDSPRRRSPPQPASSSRNPSSSQGVTFSDRSSSSPSAAATLARRDPTRAGSASPPRGQSPRGQSLSRAGDSQASLARTLSSQASLSSMGEQAGPSMKRIPSSLTIHPTLRKSSSGLSRKGPAKHYQSAPQLTSLSDSPPQGTPLTQAHSESNLSDLEYNQRAEDMMAGSVHVRPHVKCPGINVYRGCRMRSPLQQCMPPGYCQCANGCGWNSCPRCTHQGKHQVAKRTKCPGINVYKGCKMVLEDRCGNPQCCCTAGCGTPKCKKCKGKSRKCPGTVYRGCKMPEAQQCGKPDCQCRIGCGWQPCVVCNPEFVLFLRCPGAAKYTGCRLPKYQQCTTIGCRCHKGCGRRGCRHCIIPQLLEVPWPEGVPAEAAGGLPTARAGPSSPPDTRPPTSRSGQTGAGPTPEGLRRISEDRNSRDFRPGTPQDSKSPSPGQSMTGSPGGSKTGTPRAGRSSFDMPWAEPGLASRMGLPAPGARAEGMMAEHRSNRPSLDTRRSLDWGRPTRKPGESTNTNTSTPTSTQSLELLHQARKSLERYKARTESSGSRTTAGSESSQKASPRTTGTNTPGAEPSRAGTPILPPPADTGKSGQQQQRPGKTHEAWSKAGPIAYELESLPGTGTASFDAPSSRDSPSSSESSSSNVSTPRAPAESPNPWLGRKKDSG